MIMHNTDQSWKSVKCDAACRIPFVCGGREVLRVRAFENDHGMHLEITGDVNMSVRVERNRQSMRYFIASEEGTTIGTPRYD